MKNKALIAGFMVIFCGMSRLYSQEYYKLTGDITIKEKLSETQYSLYKGKLEYNKFTDRTILNFTFPLKETWVLSKDSLSRIMNGKIDYQIETDPLHKYSVFSLFLKGMLKNYGLKESLYKISDIDKKEDGTIYTTWIPEKSTEKYNFGQVVLAQKDNKLYGIAFYGKNEQLISKQIFKDYINLKGFFFPTKIIQINYSERGEEYKMTEFNNLKME